MDEVSGCSKVFAVIADESRDCSNKEQMPLIVRYMNEAHQIQESFVAFVECESGTSDEEVARLIEKECKSIGLDMTLCRGQGYDGASNMSGSVRELHTCYDRSTLRHYISIVHLTN